MTREEEMQGLKNLFSEYELDLPNTNSLEILQMAIEALEKQIPKKPIYRHGNYDCPVCGKPAIAVSARKKEYCDFCGQALDWSESND